MVEPVLLQDVLSGTDSDGASNVLIPTVEQFAAHLVMLVVSEKVGNALHQNLRRVFAVIWLRSNSSSTSLVKMLFVIGFLLFFWFVVVR